MGRLNEDAKRVLAQMKVMPVATASRDRLSKVVPMTFVKTPDDAAVLVADNYRNKGARNLQESPHIAVRALTNVYVCHSGADCGKDMALQ